MYKLKKVKTDIKKHLIINNQGSLMVNMNLLKRRIDKFLHENKNKDADKLNIKLEKLNKKIKDFHWFEIKNAYLKITDVNVQNTLLKNYDIPQIDLKAQFKFDIHDCEHLLNRILAKSYKKQQFNSLLGLKEIKVENYAPTKSVEQLDYDSQAPAPAHENTLNIEK